MRQLFDDEEGNIPRAFSDDDNRSLPHGLVTIIADDEPAPLSQEFATVAAGTFARRTRLFRSPRYAVEREQWPRSRAIASVVERAIGPAALVWSQPYD